MYLIIYVLPKLASLTKKEVEKAVTAAAMLLLVASSSVVLGRMTAAPRILTLEKAAEVVIISSNDLKQVRPEKLTQQVLLASPKLFVGNVPVPLPMIELYMSAARVQCPGLHWSIIGGVYEVESSHMLSKLPGVTSGVNWKGAAGPGQFLTKPTKGMKKSTWEAYGVDGNGDGKKNVYDPEDAVPGTAKALCLVPAGYSTWSSERVEKAIWWYNHSDIYVEEVLKRAKRLRGTYERLVAANGG